MAVRAFLVALALLACAAPAAAAAEYRLPVGVSLDSTPRGFEVSPREAIAVVRRTPGARKEARQGSLLPRVATLLGRRRWQVDLYRDGEDVVRADVDGVSGRIVGEVWTGPFVRFQFARGEKTPFRDRMDVAVILLTLLLLLPFLDPRRPLRMLHLDLLVLASFSVSFLLFQHGELYASVPLQYPPMLYLLARLLWIGFRGNPRNGPLVPFAGARLLAAGLLALVAARVFFNVAWGPVGDVGYAGMFGADSILHGWDLYTFHPTHLDTYGPVNYLLYVPFTALFPFDTGYQRDALTAAHATAIALDLVVIVLLTMAGARLRPGPDGRKLGLALAYAWAACPLTLLPLVVSANDALVPIFVLAALLAVGSAGWRGALLGLGGAAKFAPLALVPLFARGLGRRWDGRALASGALAAAVFAATFLPYVAQSGLGMVWDSTIGFQLDRTSPFTLWGLHPSLDWLEALAQAITLVTIAVTAFVARERDLTRLAALGGAVIVATQMAGNYWAHTYFAWFAAPALIALFAREGDEPARLPEVREHAPGAASLTSGSSS